MYFFLLDFHYHSPLLQIYFQRWAPLRHAGASWSLFKHWTAISEWCVVGCGSKNRHQKDMCLEEIGLCAPKMFTILGPILNIIGGKYMTIY